VQFKALGLFGLLEMFIFLGILVIGYLWIWKKARWSGCSPSS
jgi:NADH:ubiquinone oxidoreductase subunit 3 (subunit A)